MTMQVMARGSTAPIPILVLLYTSAIPCCENHAALCCVGSEQHLECTRDAAPALLTVLYD
jgi:hypothetical protein